MLPNPASHNVHFPPLPSTSVFLTKLKTKGLSKERCRGKPRQHPCRDTCLLSRGRQAQVSLVHSCTLPVGLQKGSVFYCIIMQSKLGSQTSPIPNNSVLDQVVHRKNVSVVEQNFGSRPDNPFMLMLQFTFGEYLVLRCLVYVYDL